MGDESRREQGVLGTLVQVTVEIVKERLHKFNTPCVEEQRELKGGSQNGARPIPLENRPFPGVPKGGRTI